VDIYKTASGTLYNTSVIEQNSDDAIAAKNLKRESKTYKYKDQMAEIELRKELAEKNRREGKLTDRQKKAVEAELKTEEKIRKEMADLYGEVSDKMDILSVAALFNPNGATKHIDLLYDIVTPLLKSPLVSELAVKAFLAFRDAFFEPSEDRLHELVAHTSLRVLGSIYTVNEWTQEALEDQLRRTFSALSSLCFVIPDLEEAAADQKALDLMMAEDDLALTEGITISKLGYLVPMVNEILLSKSYDGKLKDRITAFIKSAVSPNFIMDNELTSMPLVRLQGVLLNTMTSPEATEFLDNIVGTLQNYCNMLNNSEQSEGIKRFIDEVLKYLEHTDSAVRRNVFSLLQLLTLKLREALAADPELKFALTHSLYLAQHDQDDVCSKTSALLWSELRLKTNKELCYSIVDDLPSSSSFIRHSAAASLKDILQEYPKEFEEVLKNLSLKYTDYNKVPFTLYQ
jgi:hypothetical protein